MENSSVQIRITAKNGVDSTDKCFETINIKPNIVGNTNILTQDLINEPNKKYVIKYIFDLNQEEINIPNNCILEFDGGKFINGSVNINSALILPSYNCLVDNQEYNNLEVSGNPKNGTFCLYGGKPMWWIDNKWIDALSNMGILGEIKVKEIEEDQIVEETPEEGQQIHVIYTHANNDAETSYTISIDHDEYITPTGQDLSLEIPVNGYCEVNFLRIQDKIYVRGI